jgi:imidazolonepropionase
MVARGVTTVEAKSGYGLTVEDELKTLRVYRRLAVDGPARIVPTVLGAHTVPPEYADDRAGYLRLLTDELLPAVAADGLAAFCDAFVEETAFTPGEADRLFDAARALGFGVKLHADQLSDTGGAALASADHLEYVSDDGIRTLAAAGTVAVSLPLATLVLGVEPLPARALLAAGVPVAVATDFNPGSAPVPDLPTAMWAACVRQRMTPAEVLRGATVVAARALRLDGPSAGSGQAVGSLVPGARADLAVIDAPGLDAWMYHGPATPVVATVIGGRSAWASPSAPLPPE